jgi:hypothetical protein
MSDNPEAYLLKLGWGYYSAGSVSAVARGLVPVARVMTSILRRQGYAVEEHHLGRTKQSIELHSFGPKRMVAVPLKPKGN